MVLRYRFDREVARDERGSWIARSRRMGLVAHGETRAAALERLDSLADFFVHTYWNRHGSASLRSWFDLHKVSHFFADASSDHEGDQQEQTERGLVLA